jgi:hypothetical protein
MVSAEFAFGKKKVQLFNFHNFPFQLLRLQGYSTEKD